MSDMFRVQFLVDDKNLARAKRVLIGIAREVRDEPVVNAAPRGKSGVQAVTNGSGLELLTEFLRKHKQVTPDMMRTFTRSIGRAVNSYSHYLRMGLTAGLLRKARGSHNNDMRYDVTMTGAGTKRRRRRTRGGRKAK